MDVNTQPNSQVIELPFGLPGRIYRSPMPFRDRDPNGEIFQQYLEKRIMAVVVLVDDAESLARSGLDLRAIYENNGMEVIHLPITDFAVPAREALVGAVDAALERARAGKNVAVHCYAGIGRTGMFMACLARRVFGMPASQAIEWVRSFISSAVEVPEQVQIVKEFG